MQKKTVGHVNRIAHAFYWVDGGGKVWERVKGMAKKVVAHVAREAKAFYYVSKGGAIVEMRRK